MVRTNVRVGWGLACLGIVIASLALPLQAAKPEAGKGAKKKTKAAIAAKLGDGKAQKTEESPADENQNPKTDTAKTAGASGKGPTPGEVAARVDELITGGLKKDGVPIAGRCTDEDFLRRVSLDITGITPSPQEVTLFGFDSDSDKRAKLVDRLLEDADFGRNWGRYWRDVIYMRATSQFGNLGRSEFEDWMAGQLQKNESWDKIATAMLTAVGDIRENGQTALFAVHQAEPDEVASEVSRIFLGIQLQCANCHDHPSDRWKREQFHQFAAFFPRVRFDRRLQATPPVIEVVSVNTGGDRGDQLRQLIGDPDRLIRMMDKNRDGKLSRDESKAGPGGGRGLNFLFERGDADKDGLLTRAEIKNFPLPPMQTGRGSLEYYMPDLQNPQSRGSRIDPNFFLASIKTEEGLNDIERRSALAKQMTAADNPWFAKAIVNRLWGTLVGEGFYMPIDDMGPDRTPSHPEAFDALSSGFVASGYDVKWLFRTITATETYQRKIRRKDPTKTETFAHAIPTRLRADQLYSSLLRVLGVQESTTPVDRQRMPGMRFGDQSPRGQFNQLFGFDPSTAPDEINGTVPQALTMMNSTQIQGMLRADGQTRLGDVLRKYPNDKDAIAELYLLVHTREPSDSELKTCQEFVQKTGNRGEAFEDLLWSLINSTEFLTKR